MRVRPSPHFAILLIGVSCLLLGLAVSVRGAEADTKQLPPPAAVQVDFERDIRPILETSCLRCHGPEKPKSRFRLDNREDALKGGANGIAIIPGQSSKSPLIHSVARLDPDLEMPPPGKGEPLTQEQVGLLRAWIDQDVPWATGKTDSAMLFSISPRLGWATVSGNARKFREDWWSREGFTSGGERFEWRQRLAKNTELFLEGHALYEEDYGLSLRLAKTDLGFIRGGYAQYRRYFDDTGGYYQPFDPPAYRLERDLHLDLGQAWVELGLTVPEWPRMVLGYEHQFKDGSKSSLQWDSLGTFGSTKAIFPAARQIDETVEILKFDLSHEIRGVRIEDSFRGEFYNLETQRESVSFLGPVTAVPDSVTRWNDRADHFQGANALRLEKPIKDWWLLSGGYLYSKLDGEADFSLESFFPSDPTTPPFLGDHSQQIVLKRESHIFNGSSLFGPWDGLNLTAGIQNEWTRQKGLGDALVASGFPNLYQSNLDRMSVEEDFGLRYTKIPWTVVFADTRFQQERLGHYEQNFVDDRRGDDQDFLRDTEADADLKQYRAGFTISPRPQMTLQASYQRQDRRNDYDKVWDTDQTNPALGLPGNGYPAFFRSRDQETDKLETKLVLHLVTWLKTTLKYQLVSTEYHTETDPSRTLSFPTVLYPGGRILAGNYDGHVYSLSGTLTPWRRLYLSSTFSYSDSRLVSGVNNDTYLVPYRGDLYSALASATFVMSERTDLHASYSFSRADYRQDSAADGLPLGIAYDRHGLVAGVRRQWKKHLSTNLQYGFFQYRAPTAGQVNDYTAHALFATMNVTLH